MRPSRIVAFLRGDVQAERAIPKRGFVAQASTCIAAVLAFLAVFVLATALSTSRMAAQWAGELTGVTTVQIPDDGADPAARNQTAIALLQAAPGVTDARALTTAEQRALLSPWLGETLPVDLLPLPQLIEVTTTEAFDVTAVAAQLSAAVPGATIDDHAGQRRPLMAAAVRVRTLGWITMGLIGLAMAGLIALAARLSLASNRETISVLRLVGAQDAYIAQAFTRRFMLRAALGAVVGVALGVAALRLTLSGGAAAALGLPIPFAGAGALWLVLIPVLSGLTALIATQITAQTMLRKIP